MHLHNDPASLDAYVAHAAKLAVYLLLSCKFTVHCLILVVPALRSHTMLAENTVTA